MRKNTTSIQDRSLPAPMNRAKRTIIIVLIHSSLGYRVGLWGIIFSCTVALVLSAAIGPPLSVCFSLSLVLRSGLMVVQMVPVSFVLKTRSHSGFPGESLYALSRYVQVIINLLCHENFGHRNEVYNNVIMVEFYLFQVFNNV